MTTGNEVAHADMPPVPCKGVFPGDSAFICDNGRALPAVGSDADIGSWQERLYHAFGTESADVVKELVGMVANSFGDVSDSKCAAAINAFICVCEEMHPRDGLERLLILQMHLASERAATAIRQSNTAKTADDQSKYASIAAKMMRVAIQLVEAFAKYRHRERFTIHHVSAGQAIIGNVFTSGEKGFANNKTSYWRSV